MAKGKKAKKAETGRKGKDGAGRGATRKNGGAKRGRAGAEVGGVKVPKELRAFAAQAQRIAEHPIVADIVAAGLVAAAASLVKEGDGGDGGSGKGSAKTAVKAAAGAMGREVMKNLKGAAAGGAKAALVGAVKPAKG